MSQYQQIFGERRHRQTGLGQMATSGAGSRDGLGPEPDNKHDGLTAQFAVASYAPRLLCVLRRQIALHETTEVNNYFRGTEHAGKVRDISKGLRAGTIHNMRLASGDRLVLYQYEEVDGTAAGVRAFLLDAENGLQVAPLEVKNWVARSLYAANKKVKTSEIEAVRRARREWISQSVIRNCYYEYLRSVSFPALATQNWLKRYPVDGLTFANTNR